MTEPAPKRPKPFARPPYWDTAPAPRPAPVEDKEELSPTRYGDWVKNGIAVDF